VVLDDDKPKRALPEPGAGSDAGDGGREAR
jgi:hypothetical protein